MCTVVSSIINVPRDGILLVVWGGPDVAEAATRGEGLGGNLLPAGKEDGRPDRGHVGAAGLLAGGEDVPLGTEAGP